MFLHIDSDAAYLVMPESRSVYAGHFYISDWPHDKPHLLSTKRNRPILTTCKTIRNVVSLADEAENAGTFCNSKDGVAIISSLIGLCNKQPPTPLKTDNSTTDEFFNSSMKPNKSKTWDMNMHWLCDKEVLKQILVYWDRGKNNDADYFTKHFPPSVHRQKRPCYIQSAHIATTIQHRYQTELTGLCEGVLNRVLSPSVPYPESQSMTQMSNRVPCTQSLIAPIRAKP